MFNLVNFQTVDYLSMTSRSLVTLTTFFLEDNYIFRLRDLLNRGVDPCILNLWAAKRSVVPCSDEKHIIDTDLCSYLLIKVLYHNAVVPKHFMLSS